MGLVAKSSERPSAASCSQKTSQREWIVSIVSSEWTAACKTTSCIASGNMRWRRQRALGGDIT